MLDLSYVVCGCEGVAVLLLGHTGAVDAGRAHLGENLVQPLQRAIEMQFYPAGGAGHCLTSVLCSPTLDKTHANGAHSGELVDGLKAPVD